MAQNRSLKLKEHQHLAKVLSEGTTYDIIWAYHAYGKENVILSEKENEIMLRWDKAFSLLSEYHSTETTVGLLC